MTRRRRLTLLVAVVGTVLAAWLFVPDRQVLASVGSLADDPVAFGIAVAALYLVRPVLALPTSLCAAVVGYGLGLPGLPVAMLGAGLTALPTFYAARWALEGGESSVPDRVAAATGLDVRSLPGADRLSAAIERGRSAGEQYFETTGGLRGVVVARLIPVPHDAITCAAAAAGVSMWSLVVGTVLGETPWTVAAVLVGASAARVSQAGLEGAGPIVVVAALAAACLLAAGPAYGVLRRRRGEGS